MSKLLKIFNSLHISQRNRHVRHYNWFNEGIQYPGFKYYPKHPDFQDPPYEPSKLFRVQRIKPLKGVPFYEKHMLKEFGLDKKLSEVVIVKNIPENNQRLWKIKHLIQMQPVTFPNGFPEDINGTYLKENGELVVSKNITPSPERLQLTDNFKAKLERVDGDTLRRDSRKRWLTAWE